MNPPAHAAPPAPPRGALPCLSLCLSLCASIAAAQPAAPPAAPPAADPPAALAPPPEVEMRCDPNPVKAALPTTCTLTITHAEGVSVKVNAPPGAEEGSATLPAKGADGRLTTTRSFTLRHLDLNKRLRVRGVRVAWDSASGATGEVRVPDQTLSVQPTLMGVSDPQPRTFRDPLGQGLKPAPAANPANPASPANPATPAADEALERAREAHWLTHAPPPLLERNWALIVALGLALMALTGVALGWAIRRWAEARAAARAPFVDPRPAHEIALADLDALVGQRLAEEGHHKRHYHALSEIVRAYVGRRYDLHGLEMTSDEVREAVRPLKLGEEAALCLEDFLSDADLVKFADLAPSLGAASEATQRAYRFVRLTRADAELTPPATPAGGDA